MVSEPVPEKVALVRTVEKISVAEFLQARPPGSTALVATQTQRVGHTLRLYLQLPVLTLYCASDECDTARPFDPFQETDLYVDEGGINHKFVKFRCRVCRSSLKVFALRFIYVPEERAFSVMKIGEDFPYGEPIPSRVLKLVEGERDYFLKGKRAENQDLGIAAFAYYRRVVENQSKSIFAAIIKAAQSLGASEDVLGNLGDAAKESQFTKAVEMMKHAIPEGLRIDGHNPLTLLHDALSDGLHAQDDKHCLEMARSIRIVLVALVERISTITRDDTELKAAVRNLLRAHRVRAEAKRDEGAAS